MRAWLRRHAGPKRVAHAVCFACAAASRRCWRLVSSSGLRGLSLRSGAVGYAYGVQDELLHRQRHPREDREQRQGLSLHGDVGPAQRCVPGPSPLPHASLLARSRVHVHLLPPAELSKEAFKPDSDGERKMCKCLLKLINDQSSDVQSLAVKCLSPLVRKVRAIALHTHIRCARCQPPLPSLTNGRCTRSAWTRS